MSLTKNQENKFTMFKAVDTLLDNNAAIVATITVLGTKQTDLKAMITSINSKSQEKDQALQGKALDKYAAEEALIKSTLKVAGPLFAFAKDTDKNDIMDAADITRSTLTRLRDTDLPIRCQSIADYATAQIGSLPPYGIVAADVADINTNIGTFNTALGQRESGVNAKSGATSSLKNMFTDTFGILESTDKIVESIKNTEQQFYTEYQFARVIRDLGQTGHLRSGNMAPSETVLLATSEFTDSTSFTMKNLGATILHYCTGSDGVSACNITAGKVNPGETIIRTSLEIGMPGATFFKVTNDASGNGSYEVSW